MFPPVDDIFTVALLQENNIGLRGGMCGVWGNGSSTTDLLKWSFSVATTVYDPGRTLSDRSEVEDLSHLVEHNTAETYLWVKTEVLGLGPELLSCTMFKKIQWKETEVKPRAGASSSFINSLLITDWYQVAGVWQGSWNETGVPFWITHWSELEKWKWTKALKQSWGDAMGPLCLTFNGIHLSAMHISKSCHWTYNISEPISIN